MSVRRALVPLGLAATLAAGCGGAGTSPVVESQPSPKAAPASPTVLRAKALESLVRAAGADDEPRMWAALTRSSRRHLGPRLTDFRAGEARGLVEALAPFAHGSYRVIFNQRVDLELAVIAIAGRRALARGRQYGTYAVPLRLERGVWKVQVDPLLTVEAVRPTPLERVRERTQLFAEVSAPARIQEAAMWFDGAAFLSRGYYSPNQKRMSVWGEAPQPLAKGRHTVIAYAVAGADASATAWAFTVTVAGHGTGSPFTG